MTSPLDDFCGSSFWDLEIVWNTTNPNLTECFQKTVLIWVPCGFLWLFAPLLTSIFCRSPVRTIPWTSLSIAKLVVGAIITFVIIVELFHNVSLYVNGYNVSSVEFYSPVILCASFILVIIFMYAEKRCDTPPSGIIFIFWLLLSIAGAVTFRTHILQVADMTVYVDQFSFIIYMVYYPLVVAELVLCCLSDSLPLEKSVESKKKLSRELHSSFLSRVLFSWFDGLAITGYRRTLVYDDVWELNEEFKCQPIYVLLNKHWKTQLLKYQRQVSMPVNTIKQHAGRVSYVDDMVQVKTPDTSKKKRPSFFKSLWKSFGGAFLYTGVFELFNVTLQFVNPLVLELMIKFMEGNEPVWKGYFYGAIIFVTAGLQSFVHTQYFHLGFKISVKVRAAMISAIYTKALRLSNSARRSSTVGEIVNLMSVDVQYFLELIAELHSLWSAPLQIGIALYMLWGQLGPSVLAGLGIVILLLPANSYIMNKTEKLQVEQMANKDLRVKLMNELLNGIKVLKMYAWEIPFAEQINKVRFKELNLLKTMAYFDGVCEFIWRSAPFLILLASFGIFVLADSANILDASKAFVSLSLFNILQNPMVQIPMVLVGVIQARVSLNRMQDFLLSEELDQENVSRNSDKGDNCPVLIEDGTFSWGIEDTSILTNVNLTVSKGQLVAIVGTVGIGKSSVLSAIMGEMVKLQGTVKTQGNFAYTPQQAWIQNATVQENVLFGSHYDLDKYNCIIEACDLKRDIEILPAGSNTEIGEKGVNLSGGQKQRVSLARAVYNDADVYLLDDPLSAVDTHVGKHIFEKVIGPNGLLKAKTRLLVTHSITYLPQVDLIVVLDNKTISEVGSYQELLDKKGAFAEFLLTYLNEAESDDDDEVLQEIKDELILKLSPDVDVRRQFSRGLSKVSELAERPRHTSISLSSQLSRDSCNQTRRRRESTCEVQDNTKQDGKLITEEVAETGQVNFRIYAYYLSAVGVWLAFGTFILNGLAWTSSVGTNLWLEAWSSDPLPVNGTQNTALRDLRLGVYAGLGFAFAFLILAGTMTLVLNGVRASQFLHDQMLTTVIHSPMSFFDTTPVGRILNRFSQDLNVVDTKVPRRALYSLTFTMEIFGALVVIAMQTPIFLVALIPIGAFYYIIQKFYLMTSRQLKRLESITRSPIYSHFSETITGASIIRAYKKQSDFILESNRRVDESQCYYYANLCCNRWLQIRIEFVGNLIVGCAILFGILNRDTMTSSSIGLSITYALSITGLCNWWLRVISDLEKDFVAVERIKEYVETAHEDEWERQENKPPSTWPDQGCITFDNFKTRYRDGLDLVLHGISCNITSGEKVGVVGRTGAGKSSLTLALFRVIEAADGAIRIDNVDISKIGLHDLRSKLTIIPQDPILFSGTLRNNLDPFNAYTDDQLWMSLRHCHLHSFVETLPETLNYEVTEGGENLSVGQRQLVCLGRALLRKTKVLILDEATAAVDLETDDLIQATIRKEFAECTIITIAHRLNTIMDNDRVMVLDQGLIKEFDTPSTLLQDTNSVFYSMAKDAGLI